MTDEEFYRHALAMLQRELGADRLAQFLRLIRSGGGDYTRERKEWQTSLTVDDIVDSIRRPR